MAVIRVNEVRVSSAATLNVQDVLASGELASGGFVAEVERRVAEASNVPYAVAVNSGTSALALAVETKFPPGARLAVPALTFAGTANAVLAAECVPVLVDVADDGLIDWGKIPDDVDGVLPVLLWGQWISGDVVDAAQALGHSVDHGAISLYATKTGGCGEGGVFVTFDSAAADHARLVRNQGMRDRYHHDVPGLNLRLSNLHAAVAAGQLSTLDDRLRVRDENARLLLEALDGYPWLPNPDGCVWHQFVVQVDDRDRVQGQMADLGVETLVHYPVALSEFDWLDGDCPNAEWLARRVLSLPVHEHLSESDVVRVAEAFLSCVS